MRHLKGESRSAFQIVCSSLPSLQSRVGIHTVCARSAWDRSTLIRLLREPSACTVYGQCGRFDPGGLSSRGGLRQRSSRCWSRFRRGGAAPAFAGFADRSAGGNGDGRFPISYLTRQICLISGFGSPRCGPSTRVTAATHRLSFSEEIDTEGVAELAVTQTSAA